MGTVAIACQGFGLGIRDAQSGLAVSQIGDKPT
jgi:hypothetical protein